MMKLIFPLHQRMGICEALYRSNYLYIPAPISYPFQVGHKDSTPNLPLHKE